MPGNDLVARLGVDSSAWSAGFQKARATASSFGSGITSLLSPHLAAAGAALAGMWGAAESVGAYKESLQAQRKLSAVIEATGGAAGLTTAEIASFSAEMQTLTNFEDDATTASAAVLAAFTNIRGQTFTDTIESAMDLTAIMGGDLTDNVKLLGKALNDPSESFGKLRKAGVMFTDEQQKQISTMQQAGDLIGAQTALLDGVRGKFGGAAMALADPWTQLKNSLGDVAENIGSLLLPSINVISEMMTDMLGPIVDSGDGFKAFGIEAAVVLTTIGEWVLTAADSLTATLYPAIVFVSDGIGQFFEMVGLGGGTFQDFMVEVSAVMENMGGIISLAIDQWALFFVQVAADAAHLFTGTIPAYINWFGDNFLNILQTIASNNLSTFENIGTNIKSAWTSILNFFKGKPLDFNWTKLTKGFINTIEKLPDIPPRAIGELEQGLKVQIAAGAESLNESMNASRESFTKGIEGQRERLEKMFDTNSKVPDGTLVEDAEAIHPGEKKSKSQAALAGSKEANQILLRTPEKDSPVGEQKKTNEILKDISKKLPASKPNLEKAMSIANFGVR